MSMLILLAAVEHRQLYVGIARRYSSYGLCLLTRVPANGWHKSVREGRRLRSWLPCSGRRPECTIRATELLDA